MQHGGWGCIDDVLAAAALPLKRPSAVAVAEASRSVRHSTAPRMVAMAAGAAGRAGRSDVRQRGAGGSPTKLALECAWIYSIYYLYGVAKPEFRSFKYAGPTSQQAARQPVGPQRLRAVALSAIARGTSERIFG